MSIPRIDPNMTMKELDKEGALFLKAGKRYWEAAHKAGISGAVIWLDDTEGFGVIFTRGEYKQQIIGNIERMGPTRSFGAMTDE